MSLVDESFSESYKIGFNVVWLDCLSLPRVIASCCIVTASRVAGDLTQVEACNRMYRGIRHEIELFRTFEGRTVARNFSKIIVMLEYENAWLIIRNALNAILSEIAWSRYEHVYMQVVDICVIMRMSVRLRADVLTLVGEHLEQLQFHGAESLQQAISAWITFKAQIKLICDISVFMDNQDAMKIAVEPPTIIQGLTQRFSEIVVQPRLSSFSQQLIKSMVLVWLDDSKFSHSAIRNGVEMLVKTGCFTSVAPQILQAHEQCQVRMQSDRQQISLSEYCTRAQEVLAHSDEVCATWFADNAEETRRLLYEQVRIFWISQRMSWLLEQVVNEMQNLRNMQQVYKLFSEVADGHLQLMGTIQTAWQTQCQQHANQVWIDQLLQVMDLGRQLIIQAFANSSIFQRALVRVMERAMSQDDASLQLAQHLHQKLIKRLDSGAMRLFEYLEARDVFDGYYRHFMSRRLLSGSGELERETAMVRLMAGRCGSQYTSKMELMLRDVQLAQDLNAEFHRAGSQLKRMSVRVLTSSAWPVSFADSSDSDISKSLLFKQLVGDTSIDAFTKFYSSRHVGRKLQWAWNQSTVQLLYNCGSKQFDLQLSVHQAVVLFAFMDVDVMSMRSVHQVINISSVELIRAVKALCHVNLLSQDGDVVQLNMNYTNISRRIRVPQYHYKLHQPRESGISQDSLTGDAVDTDSVMQLVHQERKHAVDASIVRFMKQRQSMQFNQLVAAVLQSQSIFKCDGLFVKQRIEHLVEREFLARSQQDRSIYEYIA